jgi:bifunctional DNA primase/polymerase-like protein
VNDVPTIALLLWRLGLYLIPVPRANGGTLDGKTPVIQWRRYQTHRPTEREIRRWFSHAPMNIAIITGASSGVVGIDADDTAALRWCTQRLPYTPWQTKTSHGFHLYYRHPGVRIGNKFRLETNDGKLKIDTRGDGGFLIAPGSVHASGALYEFAGDWNAPREELPYFWPGWLQRAKRPSRSATDLRRPTGNVVERARRYLAAIPKPEIGCGSDNATLYTACRLVRGFSLTTQEAEALLWEWAGNRPGWTREWVAAKVVHADRYGTEPVGALR